MRNEKSGNQRSADVILGGTRLWRAIFGVAPKISSHQFFPCFFDWWVESSGGTPELARGTRALPFSFRNSDSKRLPPLICCGLRQTALRKWESGHYRFCPCAAASFCEDSIMAGLMANQMFWTTAKLFARGCDRLSPIRISQHWLGLIQC